MGRRRGRVLAALLVLGLVASDTFYITRAPEVVASKDPTDYPTDADLLTVRVSTSQPSQAQVKDGSGRVLGSDAAWLSSHEVTIGQLNAGTYRLQLEAFNATGSLRTVTFELVVNRARAELVALPAVYQKAITIPCRSSGSVEVRDYVTIANRGKLEAYNVAASLDSSYMCNEDGKCDVKVSIGDYYQERAGFTLVQSGGVQHLLLTMKTVQTITPWTTYTAKLIVEGPQLSPVLVPLQVMFQPELDISTSPDSFAFENACGNEARSITVEDRCCVYDLPFAVDVNVESSPIVLAQERLVLPRCGSVQVPFTLANLTLPDEAQRKDEYAINLRFGSELRRVPVSVTVRSPELQLSPMSVRLDAPCKSVLERPIELYAPSTSGCVRDVRLSIAGRLDAFTFDVRPTSVESINPGKRVTGGLSITVPRFIEAGDYAGRLVVSYAKGRAGRQEKEVPIFLKVPAFDYVLSEPSADLRELRCGDFYSQNVSLREVDGGCVDGIRAEVTGCDFNNTFVSLAKGAIGVSARESGDFDVQVSVPPYLEPRRYTCGVRIVIPRLGDRVVPISFTIPPPVLRVEMPPKLTLYKERPPSVQGATNITVAEVGGFTPIRNVTFSVRARSCPDGANATCERYARAVSPISPLLLVDKGGRASVPVQMSFDFSDPRGDYAMGVAIDAANDARAREERLLELEIIPPSCRKARDDIKLVGAEFYLAKKALRDFLAPCDEWSKTDPVKAAKASSLVSAFIVFSTNIAVLKGQVAGHNVSSVKVLSVLRSSERNLDGLCVGIEGSEPLCEMANATLRGTLREVGGYYCSNGTTRSELLRRNGAIANVFLSPLGLRCAALTALDRVAARYEEALALRAQAQAARIVPPRALGRYPEVVQRLEEARRGYDELGLSEDASRVAGELGSVERERIELERLWTALLRVAAALAALATLILCGMYTQYRLKTRKVLEL